MRNKEYYLVELFLFVFLFPAVFFNLILACEVFFFFSSSTIDCRQLFANPEGLNYNMNTDCELP